jgi:pyocin large subunit-like protein
MDLVGWDTTCVQGPNGPIVTTYLSSGTIVTVAYGGLQTNAWGNPSTLQDHFNRHGSDFRSSSPDDYAQQAQDFLIRSQAENLPTKIDADGVIRVYDPVTNEFGAYNADGTTRTYFRPSSTSYFLRQPGVDVKIDTPVQLELPFE